MAESAYSALVHGRPAQPSSVGGMSIARLMDLNLIHLIKEKLLPINGYVENYTETKTAGPTAVDPNTGLSVTPYKFTYNDWFYYNPDSSNPGLSGVLEEPTLSVSGSLAYIDFAGGTVYYSGVTTHSLTATYSYYNVYVQDGFPDWGEDLKDFSDMKLPMISVELMSRRNTPFYIGGRYEEDRTFAIDILANSDPQRDDITDIIEDALRYDYTDALDYRNGFPLQYNGDKNRAFDRGAANAWERFRFEDASSRIIRDPDGVDKLRHRSVINVTLSIV